MDARDDAQGVRADPGPYVPLDPFESPDGAYETFTLGSMPATSVPNMSWDVSGTSGSALPLMPIVLVYILYYYL